MPVTICSTSTNAASEPKKYQKLKFFGATYLPHWLSHSAVSGKRSSTQVMNLLIERSVRSRVFRIRSEVPEVEVLRRDVLAPLAFPQRGQRKAVVDPGHELAHRTLRPVTRVSDQIGSTRS